MDALLLKYHMMIFHCGNLSGFRIFSRIFPDFHQIFKFLHRIDGLLLTYDKIILSGNLSGFWILPGFFRIFPGFFRIFVKSSHFFTECMIYFSHMIWWFPFPDIFPDFSRFSLNLQVSLQNGWFTSHVWYDDFVFRKFI